MTCRVGVLVVVEDGGPSPKTCDATQPCSFFVQGRALVASTALEWSCQELDGWRFLLKGRYDWKPSKMFKETSMIYYVPSHKPECLVRRLGHKAKTRQIEPETSFCL